MLITTDLVMSHKPCYTYTEERLNDILGDGMELTEVLRLGSIPPADRIWLVCREGILTEKQRDAWLEGVVTRVIIRAKEVCFNKSWNKWADNWLDGSDRSSESAAAAAARAARAATAFYAATAAARAAAAFYAARAAAAYYAADAAAAFYVEREQQIKDALEILRKERN